MTRAELRARIWQRLDEPADGTGYYSAAEVNANIDRAQRLFALVTLCLEDTTVLSLTATTVWYHIRTTITDWLAPLRMTVSGAKLRPSTIAQLAHMTHTWESTAGTPTRYAHVGQDLLAVFPQPAAGMTLTMVYSKSCAPIADDASSPEIPVEYHSALVDGAIVFLRLKEGITEGVRLSRFLECAGKCQRYVRARSLDLRYDTIPPEIGRFDLSRFIGSQNQWQITSQSHPAAAQR